MLGWLSSWAGGGLPREGGAMSFYGMRKNWEHRCQIGVGWETGGLMRRREGDRAAARGIKGKLHQMEEA